jgi:hypothetical protein
MKKLFLAILVLAFSGYAIAALPPDCKSAFSTATIAGNVTGPWISMPPQGVFIDFSSATTSTVCQSESNYESGANQN